MMSLYIESQKLGESQSQRKRENVLQGGMDFYSHNNYLLCMYINNIGSESFLFCMVILIR